MSGASGGKGGTAGGEGAVVRRSGDEIREIFLRFFESRAHARIRAASLLPDNDPTLLFVNSGMAPLKPYFTGAVQPPHPDLCNVQPCIRTIDIDDVGDRHHLTFFEMLGSWSIGHYFKDRAVELAYELLVEHFGFPSSNLSVTVYAGDPALNLEPDHESARAWERVGIPRERIIYLGEDNFWGPAGESGPCGPCTEVFWDTGEQYGPTYVPGGHFDSKSRYIEIWNAGVFMQFDKRADGSFGQLPFRSVDTGSGLERMAMVLQGGQSVYETDLFGDLMALVQQGFGGRAAPETARVLADHVRASSFILSEGVVPGNSGRSYIPRRLIRKCVALVARAGVSGFPYRELLESVVARFGEAYPRLRERREPLVEAFLRETREFERVIDRGLERLEQLCRRPAPFTLSGKDAFELFSTYGLPVELTRDFAKERGAALDESGYAAEFERHQEISRASGGPSSGGPKNEEWTKDSAAVHALLGGRASEFLGYESLRAEGTVLGLLQGGQPVEQAVAGTRVEVVTDRTPFYAESGGQIGDRGELRSAGGALLQVLDTQELAGAHVHRAQVVSGVLREGESAQLGVDEVSRRATMANHSATHLLHGALREVLGAHVRQAGSLVDAEKLRFDFEHPGKLTPEELAEIERRVNERVRANHPRETVLTSYADAVARGALAFFGESYGEEVRMVRFGPISTELCGGTHVNATGEIGAFRILSESSIASGIRRIVALTGAEAVRYTLEQDQQLRALASLLKVPAAELPARVAQLLKSRDAAKPAVAAPAERIDAGARALTLPSGLRYVAARLDTAPKPLSEEALRIAEEIRGVAILAGAHEGSARLVVAVEKKSTARCDARKLLAALLPAIGGKGGGSPHLAQGGGDQPEGIEALLREAAVQLSALE